MNTLSTLLLRQFKYQLLLLVLVSAVINVLMLAPTIYMLQIFDRVMISKSEVTLLVISLIVIGFYGVQGFGEYLRNRITSAVSIRIDQVLSPPIVAALMTDKLSISRRNPLQAFSDLASVRQWLTGSGLHGFLDGPWTPIYLAVMFMLHPALGWLAVVFLCFLALLTWLSSRLSRDLSDASIEEERDLNAFIHSKLRNAEVLEAHGMVPQLKRRWWKRQVQFLLTQAKAEDIEERMTATTKQVRYLLNSLAIAAGAILAIEGEITMGAMIAAGLLMGRTTAPLDALMSGWKGFHMARSALSRLESLLEDNRPWQQAHALPDFSGGIRLKGIHASALAADDEPEKVILRDLNLTLPQGKVTVVMGPSGAGKSTLGKLLVGIWPQYSGDLFLGVHALKDLNRAALGREVGYVPQQVELFRGTVAENISRLGAPDSDRVIRAAMAVGIHDFILRLPNGYDTVIGEQGGHLSGGQRQRIALARALYGDPKLLVLDEPNASLDEAGEQALLRAVRAASDAGATVVLISHRPTVLAIAEYVVLLKKGERLFEGTREAFQNNLQRQLQTQPLGNK
jgi:ATP-binding cassette subfamily C exporter for protease/lipase